MTINDIRNEGWTVMNTVSLVTDVASIVIPVVPAGVSHALRAAKYASKAVNAVDTAADAKKLVSNADEVVKIVKKAPIVIGENSHRVKEYAKKIGADYYKLREINPYDPAIHDPISLKRNERWIKDKIKEGREIIDIGPDFFENRLSKGPSKWYELERRIIKQKGCGNYKKDFVRFSKDFGGVPGFDFFP